MSRIDFETSLCCPRCKNPFTKVSDKGICKKCGFKYQKKDGIWDFLYLPNKKFKKSQQGYETLHKDISGGPGDGSYEILASIARGNRSVDIACGEGIIEKLAKDTIGIDFSLNALKKAKKFGIKNLVLADASYLPFKENTFDLAISAGSLEHFPDPQKALSEMVRISKIQVITVHKHPPIPFAKILRKFYNLVSGIKDQPIEEPQSAKKIDKMFINANSHVVFKGVWTLPFNYGRIIKFLPEIKQIPSCYFYIAIKK
ncbi:methyltransferase domain-containing protein [Candidatus Daviesbacteria bacterium]|nr:methyltransferase domain-containing protein [Candidatus Daviesbacteria bacterium]